MGKIRSLPQDLINMIAAGEVVERPASVLKELLENSIDANSTRITVNITEYGKGLIEVIDNGIGMNEADALMAFEQHATSKIYSQEDLENINTLGFRGEALASISSVALKVQMDTKTDSDEAVLIRIENKQRKKLTSTKVDRGTKISIFNIFENVPARKKFLKSDSTELKYIINTFIETALINLNIHFELKHNDKLLYRLTKTDDIKTRMFEIWGNEVSESFYDLKSMELNLCNIDLLLERPEFAKKNPNIQYIYINGRRIDSKVISTAVKEAYQGFIHKDLRPAYIIVIHINPQKVDVNVHPRKLEVRFQDSQEIFRTLFSSVRKTLEINTREIITNTLEVKPENKNQNTFKNDFISSLNEQKSQNFNTTYNIKPRFSKIQDAISFSKALIEPSFSENKPVDKIRVTQIFNTYIVYEQNNDLVFIDQHAAAEKILFEKLLYSVGDRKTKPLLLPTLIELKNHEKNLVLESKKNLEQIGIVIEDFGGNSIQVVEIPEEIEKIDFNEYLNEIINNKEDFSSLSKEYIDVTLNKEMYDLLALTACHGSVRAGQKLSEEEMLNIINNLKSLKQPNNCPHGRPISWRLSKIQIEKNFRRVI